GRLLLLPDERAAQPAGGAPTHAEMLAGGGPGRPRFGDELVDRDAGELAAERPLRGAEPGDQGVVGEDVDAPRDAAGRLGDQPGRALRHYLRQVAGAADPQPVVDIIEALLDA